VPGGHTEHDWESAGEKVPRPQVCGVTVVAERLVTVTDATASCGTNCASQAERLADVTLARPLSTV